MRHHLQRPNATAASLQAIERYRLALPPGDPQDIDRAVIAVLLSYAFQLDHDPAVCGSLALLGRVKQLVRKVTRTTSRVDELVRLRNAADYLANAGELLQSIDPQGYEPPEPIPEPIVPKRWWRKPDPTPEEIAARCAEIRAERLRTQLT
jgi:hypothetical protein